MIQSYDEFMDEKTKVGLPMIKTSRTLIDKTTNTVLALFYKDSPETQDIIKSNGIVIYFTGNRTKAGNPSLNQLWQNQTAFQQSKITKNEFPVFYNSGIMFGFYVIDEIVKRAAPNGCTYFSIKLLRKVRNKNIF